MIKIMHNSAHPSSRHQSLQAKPVLYKSILYTESQVATRITEMAETIIDTYVSHNPLFVCLLRGGAPFASRLMFAITKKDPHFYPELDYMTVRTYGNTLTPKEPQLIMGLSPHTQPKDRPAIILDDVLDTGETADFVAKQLRLKGATSVDLCVLVKKQKKQRLYDGAILAGFDAPADWLTGMGLDDPRIAAEANRWAGYVALGS